MKKSGTGANSLINNRGMNVSNSTFQTKRRGLKKVEDEENAATLHLGEEFQLKQLNHDGEEEDLVALNLSEARLVIREALTERKKLFGQVMEEDSAMDDKEKELQQIENLMQTTGGGNHALKTTMVYLANFARFRDPETVTAVATLLRDTGLHPFEIAQLGTLSCEDADEAKTLIPSLASKLSDEELERILKELSNLESLY